MRWLNKLRMRVEMLFWRGRAAGRLNLVPQPGQGQQPDRGHAGGRHVRGGESARGAAREFEDDVAAQVLVVAALDAQSQGKGREGRAARVDRTIPQDHLTRLAAVHDVHQTPGGPGFGLQTGGDDGRLAHAAVGVGAQGQHALGALARHERTGATEGDQDGAAHDAGLGHELAAKDWQPA